MTDKITFTREGRIADEQRLASFWNLSSKPARACTRKWHQHLSNGGLPPQWLPTNMALVKCPFRFLNVNATQKIIITKSYRIYAWRPENFLNERLPLLYLEILHGLLSKLLIFDIKQWIPRVKRTKPDRVKSGWCPFLRKHN